RHPPVLVRLTRRRPRLGALRGRGLRQPPPQGGRLTMNSSTPIDTVVDALRTHGCKPRRNGTGWSAKCPAHDDRNPHLSANECDDGRAFVHCHAGCATDAVLEALGLSAADLFADAKQQRTATPDKQRVGSEQRYEYRDENGKLLYHQVRQD